MQTKTTPNTNTFCAVCEIEALAIKCALEYFSLFIKELKTETELLTDSKPWVETVDGVAPEEGDI